MGVKAENEQESVGRFGKGQVPEKCLHRFRTTAFVATSSPSALPSVRLVWISQVAEGGEKHIVGQLDIGAA